MKRKIFSSICLVIGIVIIVTTGTTFAYYVGSASNTNTVTGGVTEFSVGLTLTTEYKATKMIPLKDSLVSTAIQYSSKCRDKSGYEVCSLYKLKLTNTGPTYVLNGYLKTSSTTYTTSNLKYQIFNSSYTAVSDVMTVSTTANGVVYFTKNNNKVSISMGNTTTEYYLVMWISDTNSMQTSDYSKTFSGVVGFEATSGNKLQASI